MNIVIQSLAFISILSPSITLSQELKQINYDSLSKVNHIDSVFPDINGFTVDKILISKNELKGRIVVINVWDRNCAPCIAEIPGLDSLVKYYNEEDIKFIAISSESNILIQEQYLNKNRFLYKQLVFPKDTVIFKYFGYAVPLNIVLDKNGIVKYFNYGGFPDERAPEAVFNKIKSIIEKLKTDN